MRSPAQEKQGCLLHIILEKALQLVKGYLIHLIVEVDMFCIGDGIQLLWFVCKGISLFAERLTYLSELSLIFK